MNQQILILLAVVFITLGVFIIFIRSEKAVNPDAKLYRASKDDTDSDKQTVDINPDIISLDNKGNFYKVNLNELASEGEAEEHTQYDKQQQELYTFRDQMSASIDTETNNAANFYRKTYMPRGDMKYYLQKSFYKYMDKDGQDYSLHDAKRGEPFFKNNAKDGFGGDATFALRARTLDYPGKRAYLSSWYKEGDIMEVKVYSNGGCIIQRLTVSELDTLLQRYSVYLEVKL